MNKITQYILKELIKTSLVITFLLISSLWVVQSLKFMEVVLRSQESFEVLLHLMLLASPDLLVIILPIASFIAVIFIYNRFHSDRELVAVSASGYSSWNLAKPALSFAMVVTISVYLINIFVLPWSFQKIRDMESRLKNSLPGILLQPGVFNSFNEVTIYVNKKEGSELQGILAHVHKKNQNPYTIMAKEGRLVIKDKMPQIIMVDGNRQELNPEKDSLSILYFDQTLISLLEDRTLHPKRPKKPYEFTLSELLYQDHRNITFPYRQRLYAEGYQRLLTPWYAMGFISIALVFLLMAPFRRGGQILLIMKATLGAIILQSLCLSLMNLGVHLWYAILLAYGIMGATIIISILILKHTIKPSYWIIGDSRS